MAEQFVGKWNLVESTNFDNYMKEVGVGLVTRNIAAKLKPSLDISVDGNHWKIISSSTFKTFELDFNLDEEFETETADGRKVKSTFSFNGTELTQQERALNPKEKDSTFVRSVNASGQLVIDMDCNGVKATRVYTKA